MDYYEIPSWPEYQHYRSRNPPWIKLHSALLQSRAWVLADNDARVLMVVCMLLGSRADVPGQIPADPEYIQRVAYLDRPPDFAPLLASGFLALASASACKRPLADASPEERRGEERQIREEEKAGGVPLAAVSADPERVLHAARAWCAAHGHSDRVADVAWPAFQRWHAAQSPPRRYDRWDLALEAWVRKIAPGGRHHRPAEWCQIVAAANQTPPRQVAS